MFMVQQKKFLKNLKRIQRNAKFYNPDSFEDLKKKSFKKNKNDFS